jgi:hypothetical protein
MLREAIVSKYGTKFVTRFEDLQIGLMICALVAGMTIFLGTING